jgi:high affinity Mn2+ porin
MRERFTVASAVLAVLMTGHQTWAADQPAPMRLKSPIAVPKQDWTGLYLGGHTGYGFGQLGTGTNPLPLQGVLFPHSITGLLGGYQAGYNWQLRNGVVLGVEADVSFTSPLDQPKQIPGPFDTTFDYIATARGRVGYAFGALMPYVTGGVAWGQTHININDVDGSVLGKKTATHLGWVAGIGAEVAIDRNWSGKLEYNYIDLGSRTFGLADVALPDVTVAPKVHAIKLGLNYKLWETPPWGAPVDSVFKLPEAPQAANWNVHGQTTLIAQSYPSIRSPYQGANSLPGGGQTRQTWTIGAFLGLRLWDGGEVYFNPELAQGFGLASTLGLGGFSNGEAQKGGTDYPKFRAQRYFFRQTFGLGGEQEEVADGPNQLAGKRDIDRITLTVGRFAIGDFFDGNAYAKDPRTDFMNWAMWSSAAYDFPADLPGFTRGAVVELNRKDWAVRAGVFQVPARPNSDVLTLKTGGAAVEFEERHAIFEQPGKLRVGVFANKGITGSYRDALAAVAADPVLDINDFTAASRRERSKYGVYVNLEQQVMTDVGVFARASWNDGKNEILSFTDIDRSLSGGVSVKGSHWGRPADTFGLGGAVNGLSAAHRDYLAAGGIGLLIGDGRLNYGTERILETYYALALNKAFTFTADYQFITNPAYNKDRGPVSIFSGRLHGEF